MEIHKGLRECKHGSEVGVKKVWKSSTVDKYFYARYEKVVEKLNNNREIRLFKLRFEPTLERTDISRQAKWVKVHKIAKEKGIEVVFKVKK